MEIKNTFSLLVVVSLVLGVVSCQSGPRRAGTPGKPGFPRGDSTAPTPPEITPAVTLPEVDRNKKVAVILGPGGAKTFAHIGVLKAFQQERVPVQKIVGLEWGSLMAGLFAVKGQVHDMEWKLYKMEQLKLPQPKGLFARKVGEDSVRVMDNFLKDAFGSEDARRAKVEFMCPTRSLPNGHVSWQSRGEFTDIMQRCLPFPPVFKAGNFVAGPSLALEAIERLAKEGYNIIVFVNVLGSAMPMAPESLRDNLNQVLLWQEVRRALHEVNRLNIDIVEINTNSYPILRFDSKKDLIQLGESAGRSAARSLVSKYGF